jgi:hypothetical protein
MATVINNPGGSEESSGLGMMIGVILAVLVIILFFVYGLPAIRNSNAPSQPNDINVDVDLPSGGGGNSQPDSGAGAGNYQ